MKGQENKQARIWLNTILFELKSTYSELVYPLSVLRFEEDSNGRAAGGLVTDGVTIYYNPADVLRHTKEQIMRQVMHIVLHGLLGHFQIKDQYDQHPPRDLMMDLQVDYLFAQMGGKSTTEARFHVKRLENMIHGDFTMGSYHRLIAEQSLFRQLEMYSLILRVDDHKMWDQDMSKGHKKKVIKLWGEIQEIVLGEDAAGSILQKDGLDCIVGILKGRGPGDGDGAFDVGEGSGQSYRELLRELFCLREISKEDVDSIDQMLYHYGLELNGDIPLIEPLELREEPSFHMLVIAVDVSGSCIGDDIMKKFWGETYDCISQLKDHHVEGEVLLLQCDDAIQWEQRMDLTDFGGAPAQMQVKGWGGTSFVPVFKRIEELEGNNAKVDALIYLTDGWGEYPAEKPEYPVYFVLPKGDFDNLGKKIPAWINKICLT